MTSKKWITGGILVLATAGFLTATAGYRWWKGQQPAPVVEKALPAAGVEYRKIYERYRETDSAADISGSISVYDGEHDNALKEKKTFRCIRSGGQYYMQLSYLQTFGNGSVLLQLDTVNKRILVSKAPDAMAPGGIMGKDPFEQLFSDTARFRISGTVSSGQRATRVLRLQSDFNPQVRSYSLFYDTLTYRLHSAEIEWWKNGPDGDGTSSKKIWLGKIDYSYHPAGPLNMSKRIGEIISIINGQVRPTAAYQDYQVNAN